MRLKRQAWGRKKRLCLLQFAYVWGIMPFYGHCSSCTTLLKVWVKVACLSLAVTGHNNWIRGGYMTPEELNHRLGWTHQMTGLQLRVILVCDGSLSRGHLESGWSSPCPPYASWSRARRCAERNKITEQVLREKQRHDIMCLVSKVLEVHFLPLCAMRYRSVTFNKYSVFLGGVNLCSL